MNDREQIIKLYHEMYAAMTAKNEAELNRVHDDSFVLVHMTGMRQGKQEYIRAVMNGTLNYYSEETENIDVDIDGDRAVMTGNSRVSAAVFGGGRHTWRLALRLEAKKSNGKWKFTKAEASVW
ncbi:MAG: nuclear transport factor 2 family protein [Firmicutes bacterium]|nr:nuclear transport factor 2 family protein [Bacillota bacterium]MBR0105461.1 nuclear transport factor 2 family protein [Bacillota bacterium]